MSQIKSERDLTLVWLPDSQQLCSASLTVAVIVRCRHDGTAYSGIADRNRVIISTFLKGGTIWRLWPTNFGPIWHSSAIGRIFWLLTCLTLAGGWLCHFYQCQSRSVQTRNRQIREIECIDWHRRRVGTRWVCTTWYNAFFGWNSVRVRCWDYGRVSMGGCCLE